MLMDLFIFYCGGVFMDVYPIFFSCLLFAGKCVGVYCGWALVVSNVD